jgi:hypothetical protein
MANLASELDADLIRRAATGADERDTVNSIMSP